jgi:uncharacterized protein YndB with AHSA1/START domain
MKNTFDIKAATELVVTQVFGARLEDVWRACSESAYVKQWWGPIGFTCPVAEMDFRVGGTSLVCMKAPEEYGGGELYTTWTYQRIVPMEKIDFIQAFSDKDGNLLGPVALGLPQDIPKGMRHVIIFKRLAGERTEMTVTVYGYTTTLMIQASRMRLEQCHYKLAASLGRTSAFEGKNINPSNHDRRRHNETQYVEKQKNNS